MPVTILHDPTTKHQCPGKDTWPVHYDHKGTQGWYVVNGTAHIKYCPFCGEDLVQATLETRAKQSS